MRKIEILAICCMSVLMLQSCGGCSCSRKSDSSSKSSSLSESEDLNYQKACADLDFEKAHQILNKLREVFVSKGLKQNTKVDKMKGYKEYTDADIYIFREEATYLMSLDDPAAESRIAKLIMETPLDGTPKEEGRYGYYCCEEDSEFGLPNCLYRYCIMRYNKKCNIVMDLAILHGNKSFAQKVLMYYKDSMHLETIGHDYCKIWYDSSDKDAAQKKYDEAVENGVFQK